MSKKMQRTERLNWRRDVEEEVVQEVMLIQEEEAESRRDELKRLRKQVKKRFWNFSRKHIRSLRFEHSAVKPIAPMTTVCQNTFSVLSHTS